MPAVSRRYGGCKRSRSSVFSSECRCEVFLSISLLPGVYDGDKRTCWRAILTEKRKTESFFADRSAEDCSHRVSARSRSIGRGCAVANVNNETIVPCLTRFFTARPRSRLKAPLACCSRADKHTHDVVWPCTCSRWLDRSANLKFGWRRVSCKLAKMRKGNGQWQWTKSVFIEGLGTKDVKTCCAKKMDLHSPRNK